jgi:RHS repeat-associated protein
MYVKHSALSNYLIFLPDSSDKKYAIVTDCLGAPAQMYDEKGQLVWETHLDIYGKVRTFAGRSLSDCPFRYQGQYEDAETGLYYNRFRYYSPEEGMYLSQDPIGLAGGNPTLYGYVKDVNSWIDVLGLSGFFTPTVFNAPSGNVHTVYQQNIDWDLKVNTSEGIKTNLELAQMGRSPFVVKDGKYSLVTLHHSKQNAKGSLFELSTVTHRKYYGSNALHPYLPNKHPINQVSHDDLWKVDREAYWKQRAEAEVNSRKAKVGCH